MKNALGFPSAVSSSMGGVLTRTASCASHQYYISEAGELSRGAAYSGWELANGCSEAV